MLATGRFGTDKPGYAAMRKHVASYPDRVWAVEGSGTSPACPAAAGRRRARRGRARRSSRPDAVVRHRPQPQDRRPRPHAVAVVAVHTKTLRVLSYDAELEVLRMLVDRRDELTKAKVQAVNLQQRLLSELVPGQSKKDITALQAKKILAGVRPRDVAGKTRKRLALEQLAEMVAIQAKIKASTNELKTLVLPQLHPDGPDRSRAGGRGQGPRRRRRRHQVHRPQPVRVLDRHRTPGRLLRGADQTPPLGPGTARPPTSSTSPPARSASTPPGGPTTGARSPRARPGRKRCAA